MLVLASQSPRRRELLAAAGIPHVLRPVEIDESQEEDEDPIAYVRRVARAKALTVPINSGEIVLAADTTVISDGLILGKPRDDEDARRMLNLLSGRSHQVATAICLRTESDLAVHHEITQVWFCRLTNSEIAEYVASGEPMDKAGAYAIQGIASRFIPRIEGDYSNVVGLPVARLWRELERIRSSSSASSFRTATGKGLDRNCC